MAEFAQDGAVRRTASAGGSLKQMLSDMATSGVWDVENDDEPIEPRLIA